MIDVSGEGKFLSIFGDDVAGETFAVQHHLAAQLVIGAKGASFCEHVACALRIFLNFYQRAVFSKNGERLEKGSVVRPGGPIGEEVDHEIGAEEIGPMAASAIALGGAVEMKLDRLRK